LDLFFGMAARGPRFFEDGWGDRAIVEALDLEELASRRASPIQVRLGEAQRAFGGIIREGTFASPETRLPECARTARIRMLLPRGEARGVAVHLAASADQGFGMRLRFAAPLLAHGIGAVVLENAYYGARRPAKQVAHAVRSVADLGLMGSATVQEGRALLRWLRSGLGFRNVGVTGFSMGGQMAAMVGATTDFPVAVVPIAASCSPDTVLRHGVLRHAALVSKLCCEGESEELAREGLLRLLARFSVTSLPAPVLPAAAIVVGTRDDGVVPPGDMQKIAEYWGAELRWLPAGHVSAVLRHQGAMRQAILDAFTRLAAARLPTRRRRKGLRAPSRAMLALAGRTAVAARGVERSAGVGR
jgi:hypothetical protein